MEANSNETFEDCQKVHDINGSEAQCIFVKNNDHCQESDGFFNYVEILYCDFSGSYIYLGIALYSLWLLILFIGLAISADDYFCPNLAVISKTLRLSQNIAGVTILAFGNGAPDIFSALAAVSQARPELVLGGLFGAGVFVTTAVAGAVSLTRPFPLMERPFLRDVTFYLAAAFWAFTIFYRGEIRLSDSLGFLGMYVVYILVVIIGRMINQKIRAKKAAREDEANILDDECVQEEVDEVDVSLYPHFHMNGERRRSETRSDSSSSEANITTVERDYRSWVDPASMSTTSSVVFDHPDNAGSDVTSIQPPRSEELKRLASKLNPFSGYNDFKWYIKLWSMLKSPVVFVLSLTIPVVEEDDRDESWCQSLHALQFLLAGQFVAFVAGGDYYTQGLIGGHLTLWQLVLILSLAAIVLFLCTSRPEQPPVYQPLLAFLGFIVAVAWIYVIANEIVSLLKALGVFFGLSDAILGLTVLAWGNSIGDLIADVAIAKAGFPRMGYSACFGGPLFNLLLGIGLPFTIAILKNNGQPISVPYNYMVLVLSAALGIALLASFIIMPLSGFQASRKHGIAFIILYIALLTSAIVIEFSQGGL